ncbi:MAG: NUDIX domain-containing protein [Candidatus Shapirobacteria bacterium]
MRPNQLFYVSLKAFIEKDNKLLILINNDHGLDFPGGQIQAMENNLEKILQREVKEETNLEIKVNKPFVNWIIEVKNPAKSVFFVAYKCSYLSGQIKLSQEHMDFHWIDKNNYPNYSQNNVWFKLIKKYFVE